MAAESQESNVVDLGDYRRRLARPGHAAPTAPAVQPFFFTWFPIIVLVPLWRMG